MTLTPEERLRFIEYCVMQSSSLKMIAEQMDKTGPVLKQMSARYKNQALAYMIVAGDLGSVQEQNI